MIESESYKLLRSRIRFWKFATTVYREVNAILFVCAKGLVPILSAIVAANLAMSVRGNPIVGNEFMIWASVAILVLSGLDTILTPREKKSLAFKINIELSALQEALMIGAESAKTPAEFQELIENSSERLRKILSAYASKGWGQ
jgi:hypothetical protein